MSFVESNRPSSWSLDASETGESTKYPWAGEIKCGPNLDTLFCVEVFVEFYVYTPIPPISFF